MSLTHSLQMLQEVENALGAESHTVLGLQGDVCHAEGQYAEAVERCSHTASSAC